MQGWELLQKNEFLDLYKILALDWHIQNNLYTHLF